ncbi:hypothetical protein [Corynebacterium kalidii]|uniref:Uncharacterized protein n=1 Tax=Corynebacterium kalidii TaxID=2931982 RepID=A0A9X1WIU9_9CORY|nr:hypothetical protein [Corynebacterium kalidii]MCJ7858205.1 hypothetical protein [Corynebacterium kalidii]
MTRTSPSSDVEPTGVFAPPLRLLTLGLLISVGITSGALVWVGGSMLQSRRGM